MTQQELKQSAFNLINKMIETKAYIKGYGNLYRVMDHKHNPIRNITKQEFKVIDLNGIIVRNGLVWELNILANPFERANDVKLPGRDPA